MLQKWKSHSEKLKMFCPLGNIYTRATVVARSSSVDLQLYLNCFVNQPLRLSATLQPLERSVMLEPKVQEDVHLSTLEGVGHLARWVWCNIYC